MSKPERRFRPPPTRAAAARRLAGRLLIVLVIGLASWAAVRGARRAGWLQPLELRAYDACVRLLPRDPAASGAVVIVAVDEADIRALGHYPIYDGELADLLAHLRAYKPRAIGLDIYRDIPVPGPDGDRGRRRLRSVLLGADDESAATRPAEAGAEPWRIICIRYDGEGPDDSVAPPPEFAGRDDAWMRVGFNDVLADPDGVARRVTLFLDPKSLAGRATTAPADAAADIAFSLHLARLYLADDGVFDEPVEDDRGTPVALAFRRERAGAAPETRATLRRLAPYDGGYAGAHAEGFQVPLDYRARDFTTFSLRAALPGLNERAASKADRLLGPDDVRDKVVLVGVAAKSLPDLALTPHGTRTGVAFHASAAGQFIRAGLAGKPPVRTRPAAQDALWTLLWCLLGAAAGLTVRSPWRLFLVVAAGVVAVAAAGAGAMRAGWWLPTVPPALGLALSSFAATAYFAWRERGDRRAMHALLVRHVSRDIADEIWSRRHELFERGRIPGREVTATVLFTDIKGFTALSEATPPRQLLDWLNQYMEAMAQAVHRHGGVVNKYIGDAVMAVFGVPLSAAGASEAAAADDAVRAVRCALDMRRRLAELNAGWARAGLAPVCMRVGIYTGPVVAGSLGSADRLEYTVLGPVVNVASRLESFGKDDAAGANDPEVAAGGCRILIGEPTHRLVAGAFRTKFVDRLKLKNVAEPVPVYGVVSENDDDDDNGGGDRPQSRES